jgi:hypothetical protein
MKKRSIVILLVVLALLALGAIEVFLCFMTSRILAADEKIIAAAYVDWTEVNEALKTELPQTEVKKIQQLLQGRRGWVPFWHGIGHPPSPHPFIELKTSLGRVIEIHPYTPQGREFFIMPQDVYIEEPEFKEYLKEYYENRFHPIDTTTP